MNQSKTLIADLEQQTPTNYVSVYFSRRTTANDVPEYSIKPFICTH